MTVDEVVWFANHKYGECVYVVMNKKEMRIMTTKSQWLVFLDDLRKFGRYTLYHINYKGDQEHYHKQGHGDHLDFLVYYALRHDLDIPCDIKEFERLWEMWRLGREVEESIATWEFLSSEEI